MSAYCRILAVTGKENKLNRNLKGPWFYMVVVLLILLLFQTFRGGMEASRTWNDRDV